MMDSDELKLYKINDVHSIELTMNSDRQLTIKLYEKRKAQYYIVLHDLECSTMTNRLCETTEELQDLFIDLLQTMLSTPNISVIDVNYLYIKFPIYFGSGKTCSKQFSFKIKLLEPENTNEVCLDSNNWNESCSLGHVIVNDMIEYLRDCRLRPPWRPMPITVKQAIQQAVIPLKGQSPWDVYDEVRSLVLPYSIGTYHPKFWGYVAGSGSIMGAFAEFITATVNAMSWGGPQVGTYIECQVLSWLKVLMGFPNDETSSGILVSGTSVATIIAIAVARKKFANQTMKIYMSEEAHHCVTRATDLLNLDRENIVLVPTNSQRQINIQALETMIDPNSCGIVVGTAGTVSAGSIDDFQGLADLCARRSNDLWFHIDGAIGAVARCSKRLSPLFDGIERADSIAFDLHKWLGVPYECGCILIRDGRLHHSTFSDHDVSYLTRIGGGIAPSEGEVFFNDYGLELSRGMKCLKVWMILKTYGIETLGQTMEQNVDQVVYFGELIKQCSEKFEILATGPLNIICFRCIVSRSNPLTLELLNEFNKRLLIILQECGVAILSPIVINKEIFALRMCITNHRTKMSDIDQFMKQLLETVNDLLR